MARLKYQPEHKLRPGVWSKSGVKRAVKPPARAKAFAHPHYKSGCANTIEAGNIPTTLALWPPSVKRRQRNERIRLWHTDVQVHTHVNDRTNP